MKIKKVLVSQPRPASPKSPYFSIAEKYGVELDFRPFVRVERLPLREFKEQKVSIPGHTAVVFTSRHSIDHFFTMCEEMRYEVPDTMKYFCTSEAISLYIQKYVQYRKRKVFFGSTGKFDSLLPLIIKHPDEKYLVPMSSVHTDEITDALTENDIRHSAAVMYRTVNVDFKPGEKLDCDLLLLFTPAGVDTLLKGFPQFEEMGIKIGCFGPATAAAIKDAGLTLDFQAKGSIFSSLEEYIEESNK